MITRNIQISTGIEPYHMLDKNGASHWEFDGKSLETETTTWSEFPNGQKTIAEKILASEERNKSKRAGLSESQPWIRVGKLTIWISSFEIEKL